MASLSTHVLDSGTGRPAEGMAVSLEHDGAVLARARTDADGRVLQQRPGQREDGRADEGAAGTRREHQEVRRLPVTRPRG